MLNHSCILPAFSSSQCPSSNSTYVPPLNQKTRSPAPLTLDGSTPCVLSKCFCCLLLPVACISLTNLRKTGTANPGSCSRVCAANSLSSVSVGPLASNRAAQPARPSWWGSSTPYTLASWTAGWPPSTSLTSAVLTFSDFQRNVSPTRSQKYQRPSLSHRKMSPERNQASRCANTSRRIFPSVALALLKYPWNFFSILAGSSL